MIPGSWSCSTAVEQLQEPGIIVDLAQRCDIRVIKPGIGFLRKLLQRRVAERLGIDEGAHDPRGDVGILQPLQRPDIVIADGHRQ